MKTALEILNNYIYFNKDGIIERENAIKAMEEYASQFTSPIDTLREGWVSVNVEPEFGGEYNVVWDLEDGEPHVVTTMDFDKINKKWIDVIGYGVDKTSKVLLWQPLPQPPTK